MNIYLCSRYGRREQMVHVAAMLEEDGHTIVSRWITGVHEIPGRARTGYTVEEQAHFAHEDLLDIQQADWLVAFTEEPGIPGGQRGGRHVELGMALALNMNIVVIGPRENCFCCLLRINQFDDFPEARRYLSQWGNRRCTSE